jgi:hypothetical protein
VVTALDWHPTDPTLLAIGLASNAGNEVRIIKVDTVAHTQTDLGGVSLVAGQTANSVSWNCGTCLAVSGSATSGNVNDFFIYNFNPSNNQLTQKGAFALNDGLPSVKFSNNNKWVAVPEQIVPRLSVFLN